MAKEMGRKPRQKFLKILSHHQSSTTNIDERNLYIIELF